MFKWTCETIYDPIETSNTHVPLGKYYIQSKRDCDRVTISSYHNSQNELKLLRERKKETKNKIVFELL